MIELSHSAIVLSRGHGNPGETLFSYTSYWSARGGKQKRPASTGVCLARTELRKCKSGMRLLASYTFEVLKWFPIPVRRVGAEQEVTRSRSHLAQRR